jgi:hypothetical protein
MIDKEFPGLAFKERAILIDIFMEVHETANDIDPTAPLLYDEN